MSSFSRNKYDSLHIKNNIYSKHSKKNINVSVNYSNPGDISFSFSWILIVNVTYMTCNYLSKYDTIYISILLTLVFTARE